MQMLRSLLPNGLLALVSLAVSFGSLELGVRAFVEPERERPLAVHDVDHANHRLSFLPNHSRRYETSEYSFTASYNRFGRRDADWSLETISDRSSVLFLGDSFVYGIGVEAEDTVPSLLEARAARDGRPTEVMNFGMPAGAPPAYTVLLRDALARGFGAGTVVVGLFVGNDFYPSVLMPPGSGSDVTAQPANGPGSWLPRSELLDFLRVRVSQSTRMVGLTLTLGRWLGVSFYDGAGTYVFLRQRTPEQEALFQQILGYLSEMRELCASDGRRFLVVIFPNRIQVENGAELTGATFDAAQPDRDVLDYCRTHDIACLDLLPVLDSAYNRSGEPLYYPIDRHLNQRGYRIAADSIYAFLVNQGAFEPPGGVADVHASAIPTKSRSAASPGVPPVEAHADVPARGR